MEVFNKFKTDYWSIFKKYALNNEEQLSIEELKRKLHGMKPSFKMVGLSKFEQKIGEYIQDKNTNTSFLGLFSKEEIEKSEEILDKQLKRLRK